MHLPLVRGVDLIRPLLFITVILHKGKSQDFGYDGDQGPSHWGEVYQHCEGKHQSPIDISDKHVNVVHLPPLKFYNFNEKPDQVNVTNNGHTVMMTLHSKKMPELSGGPLQDTYRFSQLHFHWGENDKEGSENKVNNYSFPMELHMVFYQTSYETIQEAVEHPDGLTVLSFLYSLSGNVNTNYNSVLEALQKLTNPHTTERVVNFNTVDSLLMKNKQEYYTYGGSLTTPPCSEIVTWIEFKHTIPLEHDQIEMFRGLKDSHGHRGSNFRPTQPLHGRKIRLVRFDSNEKYANENSSDIARYSISLIVTLYAILLPIIY